MNFLIGFSGILMIIFLVVLILNYDYIYLNWLDKKKRYISISVFIIAFTIFLFLINLYK